jgi:Tol biopolymer transport system component
MKRFVKMILLAVPALGLLIGVSAGAASAPAGHAAPVRPRTVVSEKGPIRAFAQDETTIAWIGSTYRLRVRSLTTGTGAVLGSAGPPVSGIRWSPTLALAGSSALWTTFPSGGNSVENGLLTAAPFDPRATGIDLFSVPQSPTGGDFLGGMAGDGPTLVYGKTNEICDDPGGVSCHRLDAVGGVTFVTGQYQAPMVSGIPAPVTLAFTAHDPQSSMQISQGLIAVVPAATPVLNDFDNVPRVAPNGPVEVFRVLGPRPSVHLVSRVTPVGSVNAIALDFHQLAVLVRRADGTKALIRYAAQSGTLLGTTAVPRATASQLSIGKAGIVYRVERSIYLLSSGKPRLVWKASGTPIGLSIEGRRIAWAENVNGRGRIVALTAPTSAQVAASANEAAAPKRNGDILFGSIRVRNGSRLLYLMGPTGTHQRRLGTARNVWSPAWSPGGKWIAYGSTTRNGGLCPHLYVMRADGTHVRRLTHDRNCYLNPTWAPDGKRIAYDVWGGPATAGIWTMNLDGSGRRLLTDKGASPAWSPDGSTIAFRSKSPEAIWLMDADGSNLRQLTTPTDRPRARDDSDIEPAWSPNGKWIAFSREHPVAREWQRDIFIVRSDGSGLRQLTSHVRQNAMPAWSPDGTRIAFVSTRARRDLGDIYVMRADGTGQKRLTRNVDNQWPDWRAR